MERVISLSRSWLTAGGGPSSPSDRLLPRGSWPLSLQLGSSVTLFPDRSTSPVPSACEVEGALETVLSTEVCSARLSATSVFSNTSTTSPSLSSSSSGTSSLMEVCSLTGDLVFSKGVEVNGGNCRDRGSSVPSVEVTQHLAQSSTTHVKCLLSRQHHTHFEAHT